ncbi:GntR family transcriptional regulator [Zhihengliuella sp.]|uniref:GntR family transcriptional regulator n=1 Tax=Zhihengliuella sp. TaxID=1954483 RepID=UPI0028122903|nr:GntR family transcriptional regulator [Zhihengliuella sp.]
MGAPQHDVASGRASDRAYAVLRRDIVEWRLEPGTVLGEVEQAERIGVSRTPLREALARLVADGLARQQRGRGVVVSEVSLDHLDDLFELRRALETTAARAAARAADRGPEEFDALAGAFLAAADSPAPAQDLDRVREHYFELSGRLDALIDGAAANPYLAQALRQLRVHLERIRRLARDDLPRLRASAREHAAIARAVAAGEPDVAAAATEVHLFHSLAHIAATAQPAAPPAAPPPAVHVPGQRAAPA